MKREADGYIRPLLEDIRQIRFWIAFKTLLVAAPMLLIAICIALIWLAEEPPEAWRTTTARFKRVKHGASGRYGTPNVLLTTDGRGFLIGDAGADAAEERLTQGDLCEVTYRYRLGVESLCGLTSRGEVIVDRAEYEAGWARDQQDYPRMIIILTAVAAVAAGLSNALWCRRNRLAILRIQERIAQREAKNEARAAKKIRNGEGMDRSS